MSTNANDLAEWPNQDAVAKRLGVSRSTIHLWCLTGRIPAPVRLGWQKKFNWEEIERWLAEGRLGRAHPDNSYGTAKTLLEARQIRTRTARSA